MAGRGPVDPNKLVFVVMRASCATIAKAFTTRQAAESFVEQEKDRGLSVEEVPLCDEPAPPAPPVCKHSQTHWDRDLQSRVCDDCLEEV